MRTTTCLWGCCLSFTLLAQTVQLDPTFHGDGYTTIVVPPVPWCFAPSVAIQPDGKILVPISENTSTNDRMVLTRLNEDGTIDTTFGNQGISETYFPDHPWPADIVVLPDGKILLGGSVVSADIDFDMLLMRYLPDGTLDPTFGINGIVQTDVGSVDEEAAWQGLVLRNDGRIIQAAVTHQWDSTLLLIGYLPDGTLDPNFGTGGVVEMHGNWSRSWTNSLALQPDGKIVGTGFWATDASPSDAGPLWVTRFNGDGSVDSTFNDDGVDTLRFGRSFAEGNSIAVRPNGKILVGGWCWTFGQQPSEMLLLQFTPDGRLDTSFATNGYIASSLGISVGDTYGNQILLQPDGKVILFGASENLAPYTGDHFAMMRVDSTGVLDPTFGNGGTVITEIADFPWEFGRAAALQPDGKIIGVGDAYLDNAGDTIAALVVRYLVDGTVDFRPNAIPASFIRIAADRDGLQVVVGENFITSSDLHIFDTQGRLVAQHRINARTTTVPVPTLRSGLYIGRVTNGDQVAVAKFLIE